jgi:hypothetical protein
LVALFSDRSVQTTIHWTNSVGILNSLRNATLGGLDFIAIALRIFRAVFDATEYSRSSSNAANLLTTNAVYGANPAYAAD